MIIVVLLSCALFTMHFKFAQNTRLLIKALESHKAHYQNDIVRLKEFFTSTNEHYKTVLIDTDDKIKKLEKEITNLKEELFYKKDR